MTVQKKAQKYINQFEVIKIQNTDKTRVILKTDKSGLYDSESPLYKAVREAHKFRFPDDFIYSAFLSILEKITEYDSQDLEDIRLEVIDGLTDIYTHDLTEWLASDINNVTYLDDAISAGCTTGTELLAYAQSQAYEEIYPYVQELLNA